MDTERTTGKKVLEWVRRYLPCEIAGTTCEFGGAAIAYLVTGSFAAAAIVATIGASFGYYAAAYVNAVRTTYRGTRTARARRALTANGLALRSIAIEFGPAEVIDSLLDPAVGVLLGPILFGGSVARAGCSASLVADVGFYVLAIFSYERFKSLLAVRRPVGEEVGHGSAAQVAVA